MLFFPKFGRARLVLLFDTVLDSIVMNRYSIHGVLPVLLCVCVCVCVCVFRNNGLCDSGSSRRTRVYLSLFFASVALGRFSFFVLDGSIH